MFIQYLFFSFMDLIPAAGVSDVGAGDMSGGDGLVRWSHEGVESCGYHFGLSKATAAFR